MDEIIIFNDINPVTGKRSLFVKRAGCAVDLSKWLEIVPEELRSKAIFDQFEMDHGKHIQWHCLRLEWTTRELIGFEVGDDRLSFDGWKPRILTNDGKAIPVMGWTLEPGERLSGAIRSATDAYWGVLSVYPQIVVTRNLPASAPSELDVDCCRLRIMQADWVWRGMVLVL